jgi:hypothetical protein
MTPNTHGVALDLWHLGTQGTDSFRSDELSLTPSRHRPEVKLCRDGSGGPFRDPSG